MIFAPSSVPPAVVARPPRLLDQRGFTLVEFIVVAGILTILVLITLPTYEKMKNSAREARAMGEIRGIEKAIGAYAIEHDGKPPNRLDEVTSIGSIALSDPWGRPYEYQRIVDVGPGRWGHMEPLNYDYDLYCKGADGLTVVGDRVDRGVNADDVVRAGDGEFVGSASVF